MSEPLHLTAAHAAASCVINVTGRTNRLSRALPAQCRRWMMVGALLTATAVLPGCGGANTVEIPENPIPFPGAPQAVEDPDAKHVSVAGEDPEHQSQEPPNDAPDSRNE
ncbi:MAG: hypothetical protein R3C19_25480 [Planctomycetaceae bacterium]